MNKLITLCLACYLSATGIFANNTQEMTTDQKKNPVIEINYPAKDIVRMEVVLNVSAGEIRVNDIPVYYKPGSDDWLSNIACGEWLKNGSNTFEISGSCPEDMLSDPDETNGNLAIIHVSSGQTFHDTSTPCLLLNAVVEKDNTSIYASGKVVFSGLPESVLWDKTEVIDEITNSDRDSMIRILNELTEAINNGNAATIQQLIHLAVTDGFLLSTTPEADAEFFINFVNTAHEIPGWKIKPVEKQSLNFRIVGNGHLVWVTGKDNAPAIEGNDPDDLLPWSLQVHFGKIEGEWCILR